jgi:hypothetical protein
VFDGRCAPGGPVAGVGKRRRSCSSSLWATPFSLTMASGVSVSNVSPPASFNTSRRPCSVRNISVPVADLANGQGLAGWAVDERCGIPRRGQRGRERGPRSSLRRTRSRHRTARRRDPGAKGLLGALALLRRPRRDQACTPTSLPSSSMLSARALASSSSLIRLTQGRCRGSTRRAAIQEATAGRSEGGVLTTLDRRKSDDVSLRPRSPRGNDRSAPTRRGGFSRAR